MGNHNRIVGQRRLSVNEEDPGFCDRVFHPKLRVYVNGRRALHVNTADEELGVVWLLWKEGSKVRGGPACVPYYGKVHISVLNFNPDGANRNAIRKRRFFRR